jgi:hypothetical protein
MDNCAPWYVGCGERCGFEYATKTGGYMEQWSNRTDQREGATARSIEQQTARLPSDVFLWTALSAMATSAVLQASGRREVSNFIGEWVPTLLIFGLYNKMVKLLGSDRQTAAA